MATNKHFPYKVTKKVGSGAFGDVFRGYHIKDPNILVAIKCENEELDSKKSRLFEEYNFYRELTTNINHVGIPNVYFFGRATICEPPTDERTEELVSTRNVMVMDYLGPSIEKLFKYYKCRFSVKTVLMLAIQCIEKLEFIHNNGIIHRDIKPDNFLIGSTPENKKIVYLVDFGLSKKYIDMASYTFNPLRNTRSFTGTYRFCSMRNHKCVEQSRRDDLESLGYMILFLFKGELPWQHIHHEDKEIRSNLIFKKKNKTSIEDLCAGAPNIMVEYIRYCRLLKYDEVPNYKKLKGLFEDELNRIGAVLDYKFDWEK